MTQPLSSLSLDAALSPAGPAAGSFARLWASLWRQDYIPADLLELCRLSFARLHDDAVELASDNPHLRDAVSAHRRQSVIAGEALDSPTFSEAEKAVLFFAEYYWTDPQSITDEAANAVKGHFGEAGLVLLIEALGCIDGRIRAARCLRDIAAHAQTGETAHVH
jgi:hypothetical protein